MNFKDIKDDGLRKLFIKLHNYTDCSNSGYTYCFFQENKQIYSVFCPGKYIFTDIDLDIINTNNVYYTELYEKGYVETYFGHSLLGKRGARGKYILNY